GLLCPQSVRAVFPLSLHDALPISGKRARYSALPGLGLLAGKHAQYSVLPDLFGSPGVVTPPSKIAKVSGDARTGTKTPYQRRPRSEEHTSELQSRENLVCRLLLEK